MAEVHEEKGQCRQGAGKSVGSQKSDGIHGPWPDAQSSRKGHPGKSREYPPLNHIQKGPQGTGKKGVHGPGKPISHQVDKGGVHRGMKTESAAYEKGTGQGQDKRQMAVSMDRDDDPVETCRGNGRAQNPAAHQCLPGRFGSQGNGRQSRGKNQYQRGKVEQGIGKPEPGSQGGQGDHAPKGHAVNAFDDRAHDMTDGVGYVKEQEGGKIMEYSRESLGRPESPGPRGYACCPPP